MKAWGLAPISIWALKGATKYKRHDIVKSLDAEAIGPLRGPIRFLLAFPRQHEVSDLCALGLSIVKAAGLVQASWPAKLSPDNNNKNQPKCFFGFDFYTEFCLSIGL